MTIAKSTMAALFIAMLGGATAQAAEIINSNGKFSIWTPEQWTVIQKRSGIIADNPERSLHVVASPVGNVDADSFDEQARSFVDDQIDNVTVRKDEESSHRGLPARVLQGTGSDEGDEIAFRALVIDPGGDRDVLAVVIYGDADAMQGDDAKRNIEKILSSLTPL